VGAHLNSLVLPAFALGVFYTAILSRMTRSSLLEVLGQDYIRAARARGRTAAARCPVSLTCTRAISNPIEVIRDLGPSRSLR
jgi:ABC-type dipeptide/oligopeptide/nickel transport system permease component